MSGHWDRSAAKIYRGMTGLRFGGGCYTCVSLTSDKEIFSTNKGYRATFTKAQVGRDLGVGG